MTTIKDFAEYHGLKMGKVKADYNKGYCAVRGPIHNEARKKTLLQGKGYKLSLPAGAIEHPTLPLAAFEDGTIWQYQIVMDVPTWKLRHPAYKKTTPNSNTQYGTFGVTVDGSLNYYYVHRVVAECFFGKRNGLVINHIDGDGTNNNVENLEWATQSENMRHAFQVLGRGRPTKKVIAYNMSTKTHEIYDNSRQAAEVLGMHYQTIRKSANNGTTTRAGYKFKWIQRS